jgi:hypothetical protein
MGHAEVTELLPDCRPSGSWPDQSIQARLENGKDRKDSNCI